MTNVGTRPQGDFSYTPGRVMCRTAKSRRPAEAQGHSISASAEVAARLAHGKKLLSARYRPRHRVHRLRRRRESSHLRGVLLVTDLLDPEEYAVLGLARYCPVAGRPTLSPAAP